MKSLLQYILENHNGNGGDFPYKDAVQIVKFNGFEHTRDNGTHHFFKRSDLTISLVNNNGGMDWNVAEKEIKRKAQIFLEDFPPKLQKKYQNKWAKRK